MTLPTDAKDSYGVGGAMAAGGLLLKQAADSVTTNVMPDGGEVQATFHPGDFDGHWLSKTEIATTVELSGRAIDMKIVAHNTGDDRRADWDRVASAICDSERASRTDDVASAARASSRGERRPDGQLSGRLLPVEGTDMTLPAAKVRSWAR